MAKVLVTYDLNNYKDYTKLINELQRLGACRPLLSVWVLNSNWTAVQLREHLKTFMDSDDNLLVVAVTGDWASWLPAEANACLTAQLG